jgi:protein regulator of cytokinesis 1
MTSTNTKDVSDNTLKSLTSEVLSLREVKMQRMQKVSILAHTYLASISKFSARILFS